jgi:hypothetical protein
MGILDLWEVTLEELDEIVAANKSARLYVWVRERAAALSAQRMNHSSASLAGWLSQPRYTRFSFRPA